MNKLGVILATGLLLLAVGCGSQDDSAKTKKAGPGEVKKETKEAVQAMKSYTAQQKEEYQKKLNAALADMQKKIDELKAKAEKAAPEAKAKLQESVKQLQEKADAARKKLQELAKASGKAWDDLKIGLDKAVGELGQAYEQAKKNF